ncbi:MAG: hypothetical protein PHD76_02445 [Methylacidiphilales bacterium]|nr:hypothetical protein [Candidatus Methylacidiphilales bacterium]
MTGFDSTTAVPTQGHEIQLMNGGGRVVAITWVREVISYCMNGCYKVRDKNGVVRLITRSGSVNDRALWRSILPEENLMQSRSLSTDQV